MKKQRPNTEGRTGGRSPRCIIVAGCCTTRSDSCTASRESKSQRSPAVDMKALLDRQAKMLQRATPCAAAVVRFPRSTSRMLATVGRARHVPAVALAPSGHGKSRRLRQACVRKGCIDTTSHHCFHHPSLETSTRWLPCLIGPYTHRLRGICARSRLPDVEDLLQTTRTC